MCRPPGEGLRGGCAIGHERRCAAVVQLPTIGGPAVRVDQHAHRAHVTEQVAARPLRGLIELGRADCPEWGRVADRRDRLALMGDDLDVGGLPAGHAHRQVDQGAGGDPRDTHIVRGADRVPVHERHAWRAWLARRVRRSRRRWLRVQRVRPVSVRRGTGGTEAAPASQWDRVSEQGQAPDSGVPCLAVRDVC